MSDVLERFKSIPLPDDYEVSVKLFTETFGFPPPPYGTVQANYPAILQKILDMGLLDIDGDFVEIGTLTGGGAYCLANLIKPKGKQLYVVDIFDVSCDQTLVNLGKKRVSLDQYYEFRLLGADQWEIFQAVNHQTTNITPLKEDSKKVKIPAERLAFGFIDGNHRVDYALNDFYLIWENLSPGGVVAFHDYRAGLPEITDGIDLLIRKHKDEIATIDIIEPLKLIFLRRSSVLQPK